MVTTGNNLPLLNLNRISRTVARLNSRLCFKKLTTSRTRIHFHYKQTRISQLLAKKKIVVSSLLPPPGLHVSADATKGALLGRRSATYGRPLKGHIPLHLPTTLVRATMSGRTPHCLLLTSLHMSL